MKTLRLIIGFACVMLAGAWIPAFPWHLGMWGQLLLMSLIGTVGIGIVRRAYE